MFLGVFIVVRVTCFELFGDVWMMFVIVWRFELV